MSGRAAPNRSDRRPATGESADFKSRAQERRRDDRSRRRPAGEPQRREHVDDAEGDAGERHQPHSRGGLAVAQRWQRRPQALRGGGLRRRHGEGGQHEERCPRPRPRRTRARCPPGWPPRRRPGPNSAPKTAAPSAMPSSSPRRSCGAAVESQASPAAHVTRPGDPLDEAGRVQYGGAELQPKISVAALISARPSSATARSPSLGDKHPAGQRADEGPRRIGGDEDARRPPWTGPPPPRNAAAAVSGPRRRPCRRRRARTRKRAGGAAAAPAAPGLRLAATLPPVNAPLPQCGSAGLALQGAAGQDAGEVLAVVRVGVEVVPG